MSNTIKYVNAAQCKVIMNGLGQEVWDILGKFGHLQGGGVMQSQDTGELYISARYLRGTMLGIPPEKISGFRVEWEERERAVAL